MECIHQKTITELVAENHVRASVLYYFGVKFYNYRAETLEQVCEAKGLNLASVIKSLEAVNDQTVKNDLQLMAMPVDLVIEYLKHTHYLFVKRRLPYIGQLIDELADVNFRYVALAKDLKTIFPIFVEDFIHHIYEEEDTLFTYIVGLTKFLSGDKPASKLYYTMERHSIQEFAIDHGSHQNEMEGFRRITNGYGYCEEADLHIKVLFDELKNFEKDLKTHAKVEDNILFPKALHLERQVKLKFHDLIKMN